MSRPAHICGPICNAMFLGLLVFASQAAAEPSPTTWAARVAGQTITIGDVQAALRATFGDRPLSGAVQVQAEAQSLEQIINRSLVMLALDRAKVTASDEELAAARKQLPSASDDTGDRNVAQRLAWQIRWGKYLGKQITDQRLEEFFQAHRRDYDGTEVRVSHILLKGDALADSAVREQLVAKALKLRREITAGKTTFAAAAEQYSAGPSRRSGGDLGFIPRYEQMPESFSKAAFALAQGDISPPVVTPFGVHLLQCTDVRAGTKTWADARSELSAAYAQQQFQRLAEEMRPAVVIEYNPAVPHLDHPTGQRGERAR